MSGAGLVSPLSVVDIAASLERLLLNPEMAREASATARRLIAGSYTVQVTVSQLVTEYEAAARNAQGPLVVNQPGML